MFIGVLSRSDNSLCCHLGGLSPQYAGFLRIPFELYGDDLHPLLMRSSDGALNPVWVEVYQVDEAKIVQLDEMERSFGFFREEVFVDELGHGIHVYHHPPPLPPHFTPIPGGTWDGTGF